MASAICFSISSNAAVRSLPSSASKKCLSGSVEQLRRLPVVVALRSETLAHKLKRDYGAMILGDIQRQEPLRRLLHRLFDVETRQFGATDITDEEIFDDLNVSLGDLEIGTDQAPVSTITTTCTTWEISTSTSPRLPDRESRLPFARRSPRPIGRRMSGIRNAWMPSGTRRKPGATRDPR